MTGSGHNPSRFEGLGATVKVEIDDAKYRD